MEPTESKKGKAFYYFLFATMLLSLALFFAKNKYYKPVKPSKEIAFHDFYENKLDKSKTLGVRPGDEEKLIYFGEKTDRVLLYIHGYGASRAEGEYITDSLAKKWQANAYYLRLPGHGLDKEAHNRAAFDDYLREVEETLYRVQELGDTVIVLGTSMGALLATYLAAQYPDRVQALILFSPFYDYVSPLGVLAKIPGLIQLYALLNGNERNFEASEELQKRIDPEYYDHWTIEQKITAVQSIEDLRNFVAKSSTYEKIQAPLVCFYYYKDEANQDHAASVKAMLNAFDQFASDLKMKFPIEEGSHVLASEYVRTDKAAIFSGIEQWNSKWIGAAQ
ncbi:MAG: alpha/beta fold hydrolase [Chitinophagales bacterium]